MALLDASWQLDSYTDDFGHEYLNFPFKFESTPFMTNPSEISEGDFSLRTAQSRCGFRLFNARKIKVTWVDGSSTEVPIARLDLVTAAITKTLALENVVCVSLIGEHWSMVPPVKVNRLNYNNTGILLPTMKSPRDKVVFRYRFDGEGFNSSIVVSRHFEKLPVDIFTAQTECIDAIVNENACTPMKGFTMRHFKGKRALLNSSNELIKGSIVRMVFVALSNVVDIRNCGNQIAEYFNCLEYRGTTIADAGIYYYPAGSDAVG